ncbi:MAG: hypothetical protein ABI981_02480 [Betaproteobacteria bacterium]
MMRILAIVSCTLLLMATTSFAQAPAKAPAATAAPAAASGQANGTLTAQGKTVKFTYAAAFVDQTDKDKRVVLLLTEKPVPADAWKSHSDLMSYHRNTTPIVGIVLRIDAQGEVATAEYFVDRFPTSTSGIFQVTFDGKPGKTMTGKVKSTAAAAKLSDPVIVDATFSTAVR